MERGPLADLLGKLEMIGAPPPVLDFFNQLQQIEAKDVEKALKEGTMPDFARLLTSALSSMTGSDGGLPSDPTQNLQASEADKNKAEAEKTRAEVDYIKEQRETENAKQYEIYEKIKIEKEKVKIMRAEAADRMASDEGKRALEAGKQEIDAVNAATKMADSETKRMQVEQQDRHHEDDVALGAAQTAGALQDSDTRKQQATDAKENADKDRAQAQKDTDADKGK